jgi:hypothetical protein
LSFTNNRSLRFVLARALEPIAMNEANSTSNVRQPREAQSATLADANE